ncbi:M56 family metallopeptidase [Inquilinus sp. KBS0705]|nr:M56 family metallopeptidase [Inquilinus sp. KBS0705]
MIPYILHVALLIAVCLLFYKVLLQKETFYHLNRWILLGCLAITFLLPLIRVPQHWALRKAPEPTVNVVTPININQQEVRSQVTSVPQKQGATVSAPAAAKNVTEQAQNILPQVLKWVVYVYWFGVVAFGLNLLLQVIVLLMQAYKNPVIKDGQYRIIELDGDKAPCSFGNNIFINPAKYDWETYSQILLHEKIHIKQGHSFDLLMAELMLIFQWFNPFAWWYRKELENNLEFLTDSDVLNNKEVEREVYQMSLLKVSVPHLSLRVTTNYNQSLLKKRIVMMNAKRSNIHTSWKYFFLMPLMAFMVCALNQPVALSQETAKNKNYKWEDHSTGAWFATIKGDKLSIQFKKAGDDDDTWMNSSDFKVSDFTALPTNTKGDFKLIREAGTMNFTGKFEGNKGYGDYKFVADPSFATYLRNEGITKIDKEDDLAFFMINIKRGYVTMLKNNGYKNLSKDDLIAAAALKVDEPYIKFWAQSGFPKPSINDLVSGKALGISAGYFAEVKKAGYTNLTFDQLVSFKAQGITGQYLSKMNGKAPVTGREAAKATEKGAARIPVDDIISYKALNVDDAYVNALKAEGYTNLERGKLVSMKAVGVDAAYIRSLKAAGYKNVSADDLISAKSMGIKGDYAKDFTDAGYKNISLSTLVSLKALGVTADFISSFKKAGYDININDATSLKALGITPEYLKSFGSVGFDKISIGDATALKSMNITPEYISKMKEKGFKSNDISKYIQLKAAFE